MARAEGQIQIPSYTCQLCMDIVLIFSRPLLLYLKSGDNNKFPQEVVMRIK